MRELQLFSGFIWQAEQQRRPQPTVVAVRGWEIAGNGWGLTSYFEMKTNRICMTRDNRNLIVLLHELAHALGPHDKLDHGPAYIARQLHLLELYGEERPEIIMAAALASRVC